MAQHLICPHCRGTVGVPDELLGGAVTCPYCRGAFGTSAPAVAPTAAPVVAPAPPAQPARDPFDFAGRRTDDRPNRRSPPSSSTNGMVVPFLMLIGGTVAALVFIDQFVPRPAPGAVDLRKAMAGGVTAAVVAVAAAMGQARKAQRARYRRR